MCRVPLLERPSQEPFILGLNVFAGCPQVHKEVERLIPEVVYNAPARILTLRALGARKQPRLPGLALHRSATCLPPCSATYYHQSCAAHQARCNIMTVTPICTSTYVEIAPSDMLE